MTDEEIRATYPIGMRAWCSNLREWVTIKDYATGLLDRKYILVTRNDNGMAWWVMREKLYADENHAPISIWCIPGTQPGEKVVPAEPQHKHVAGIDEEHVDAEAWKAFKDML